MPCRSTIVLLLALACSSETGRFDPTLSGDFRGVWSLGSSQLSCASSLPEGGPNVIRLQRSGSTITGSWSMGAPGCRPAQGAISGHSGILAGDAFHVVLVLHPSTDLAYADPISALTGGIAVDGCSAVGPMTLTGTVETEGGGSRLDVEGDVLSHCPFAPEEHRMQLVRLRFAGIA